MNFDVQNMKWKKKNYKNVVSINTLLPCIYKLRLNIDVIATIQSIQSSVCLRDVGDHIVPFTSIMKTTDELIRV